jgi:hypothetical protein
VFEDPAHDLRIRKPTRYNLCYHRHVLEPTTSSQTKAIGLFESAAKRAGELGGCAIDNGTKRPWDNGQSDSGPWVNRQWDTGTMKMGEQAKGTMGQWHFGKLGQWDKGAMGQWDTGQWDSGQVNNGHVDH